MDSIVASPSSDRKVLFPIAVVSHELGEHSLHGEAKDVGIGV